MRYIILLILPLFLFSKDIYFEGGKINLEDLAITVSLETNKDIILHQSLKDRVVFLRVGKVISTKKLFSYFKALIDANGLSLNKRNGFYIVTPVTDLQYFQYRFKNRTAKDFAVHIENLKDNCTIGNDMLFCNAVPKVINNLKKMVSSYDTKILVDPYLNRTVDIRVKIIESGYNDLLTLKNNLTMNTNTNNLRLKTESKESLTLALDMFLNGSSIINNLSLNYFFEYLEKNDISKVINEPRILVTNGYETTITTGGTTRVKTSETKTEDLTATTTNYTQFDIGLQITIKAKIINDKKCKLTISLNNENVVGGSAELPITSKQSYKTTLTLDKNETIIIGGVLYEKDTNNKSKILFLGDLPLIGPLFRNNETIKDKKILSIALSIKDFK